MWTSWNSRSLFNMTDLYSLTDLEARSPKSRCRQDAVSPEALAGSPSSSTSVAIGVCWRWLRLSLLSSTGLSLNSLGLPLLRAHERARTVHPDNPEQSLPLLPYLNHIICRVRLFSQVLEKRMQMDLEPTTQPECPSAGEWINRQMDWFMQWNITQP